MRDDDTLGLDSSAPVLVWLQVFRIPLLAAAGMPPHTLCVKPPDLGLICILLCIVFLLWDGFQDLKGQNRLYSAIFKLQVHFLCGKLLLVVCGD